MSVEKTSAARELEQWLAVRKEAGLKIDPEDGRSRLDVRADTRSLWVGPELPEEYQQVGREYFARSPGSDIWVWFGDLPEATRDALWEKHKRKLAFPAGLPSCSDRTRWRTHEHPLRGCSCSFAVHPRTMFVNVRVRQK